jgi:hypothetical protein
MVALAFVALSGMYILGALVVIVLMAIDRR